MYLRQLNIWKNAKLGKKMQILYSLIVALGALTNFEGVLQLKTPNFNNLEEIKLNTVQKKKELMSYKFMFSVSLVKRR